MNTFLTFIRKIYLVPFRFYKKYISPFTPPCCRFTPTCSSYAIAAIQKFGIIRGSILAAKRLIRCNPFFKGGIDNVPDKFCMFGKRRHNGGDNI